jgi:ABC-2 type transport system ATP-binding protein
MPAAQSAPAPAPPAPQAQKPLPSKKSTASGSKESQVFDRSNRPHLENPVLLKIDNLSKRYDNGVLAVDQLNLDIHEGEIFCMLGANGAGKTSSLMLILSFSEPTGGSVEICGIDVHKDPLAAKKRMAYVSENVMLYGNFTALQNIEFFTRLAGKKASREELSKVLRRVGLSEEAHHRKVKSFSKGMRQRSGIAIAIMKDAEVILLDEPTSGLDPKGGMEFLRLLDQLRSEGRGILMTTHDIFRAKEIADRVGIMAAGNLVRVLEREEIEEADLAELYLQYIQEDVTHGKIA